MKKNTDIKPAMTWRITLLPGMGGIKTAKVKVFSSPMAFDSYVSTIRSLGVVVSFSTPFNARCELLHGTV